LAGIEGFNEINLWAVHYNGSDTQSNLALGNTLQQMLYQQVKSSALSNIPVLCLTVGGISNQQASVIGDLTNYSDYGAWHVYFGNGDQPRANIQMGIDGARNLNRSDPIQITETGYYTAVNDMSWGGGGVSEPVQAKLILNIIFVCASLGIARHHIYELVNDGTGPDTTIEGSFGLMAPMIWRFGQSQRSGTSLRRRLSTSERLRSRSRLLLMQAPSRFTILWSERRLFRVPRTRTR
jgi:hypothetical protein